MHGKYRPSIITTTRNIFKHFRMLPTRWIGMHAMFPLIPYSPCPSMLLLRDLLHSCSAQLTKAYQTAAVLFEVLKAVTQQHAVEVDHEV